MTAVESDNQEYILCILDKDIFTQEDIIKILKSGITLSDYRNKLIGKTVHLYNSADGRPYHLSPSLSNFGQYLIADINHQDKYDDSTYYTPNSIDLIASSIICVRNFSDRFPYAQWSTSSIRTWLNDTFKNGFDNEVQELMSQMLVESYVPGIDSESGGITETANYNTTDYLKLLSCVELNLSKFHNHMSTREGTPYSDIFTKESYKSSNISRIRRYNKSYGNEWWTRSMYCDQTAIDVRYLDDITTNVWLVNTDGDCATITNGNRYAYGIVPVLRLKAI